MSLNFRQIRLLTTELAALERLKHQCLHSFSAGIDPILFKVGGYIDMHNILHEFEFWPNGTTDYGVSCPDDSQVSDRCPLGYLLTLSVMIQISCAPVIMQNGESNRDLLLSVTNRKLWLQAQPPRDPFKTLIILLPVTFWQLDLQLGVG